MQNTYPFEIDHIFIRASKGAPEAQQLIDFGLTEGEPNVHPGQGTANRRFFFNNVMLELLWIADEEEVRNARTTPTGLWERLSASDNSISPFGICLRPDKDDVTTLPFKGWRYNPVYLPPELSILFADSSTNLAEPLLFYLDFARQFTRHRESMFIEHPIGFNEITSISIQIPVGAAMSEDLQTLSKYCHVPLTEGDYHSILIGFDHEQHGEKMDFNPHIPLVFKW